MSTKLLIESTPIDFELGDSVSFLHEGLRLKGTVVRVYNTRDFYHVEVEREGERERFSVDRLADQMRSES